MRKWENVCLQGKLVHTEIKWSEGQAAIESKMELKEMSFVPSLLDNSPPQKSQIKKATDFYAIYFGSSVTAALYRDMKASLSLGLDVPHWDPFDLQSFLYFFTYIYWFHWLRHLFYEKPPFVIVEHCLAAIIVHTRGGRIRIKLIQSNILTPGLTTAKSSKLTFRKFEYFDWWQCRLFCILKKSLETVKEFLHRQWEFFIQVFFPIFNFSIKKSVSYQSYGSVLQINFVRSLKINTFLH